MGQAEVLDALAKKPNGWFSTRDIAKMTNTGLGSTTMSCKKLRKHNVVDWSEARTKKGIPYFIYKFKRTIK